MKFFCETGCRDRPGGRYQIACPVCCGWRMYPYEPPKTPQKDRGARPLQDEKGRWVSRVS